MNDSQLMERACELFSYDAGELYRKIPLQGCNVGEIAGTKGQDGYIRVGISRKLYLIHRIIFLMHYGYIPKFIDHIDGDRSNNKIENIRPCTASQNTLNGRIRPSNTSGVKGVSWDKVKKKWVVMVTVNRKYKYFGRYKDIELAELVATEAREKFHGEFCRHY